jgi:hypothetical protein
MRFSQYLQEAEKIPTQWFHGSKVEFKKFDLEYAAVEKGYLQEGPGFYLSNDSEDARGYADSKFLKTIELTSTKNIKKASGKFNVILLNYLTKNIPDEESVLSNWDENPVKAKRELIKNISEGSGNLLEMVKDIWYECFKGYEKEYLKLLVKFGIDGFVVDKKDSIKHLIAYNPEILKIIKTEKA